MRLLLCSLALFSVCLADDNSTDGLPSVEDKDRFSDNNVINIHIDGVVPMAYPSRKGTVIPKQEWITLDFGADKPLLFGESVHYHGFSTTGETFNISLLNNAHEELYTLTVNFAESKFVQRLVLANEVKTLETTKFSLAVGTEFDIILKNSPRNVEVYINDEVIDSISAQVDSAESAFYSSRLLGSVDVFYQRRAPKQLAEWDASQTCDMVPDFIKLTYVAKSNGLNRYSCGHDEVIKITYSKDSKFAGYFRTIITPFIECNNTFAQTVTAATGTVGPLNNDLNSLECMPKRVVFKPECNDFFFDNGRGHYSLDGDFWCNNGAWLANIWYKNKATGVVENVQPGGTEKQMGITCDEAGWTIGGDHAGNDQFRNVQIAKVECNYVGEMGPETRDPDCPKLNLPFNNVEYNYPKNEFYCEEKKWLPLFAIDERIRTTGESSRGMLLICESDETTGVKHWSIGAYIGEHRAFKQLPLDQSTPWIFCNGDLSNIVWPVRPSV